MTNTESILEDYDIIDAHTHIYPMKISMKASQNIGRFYRLPPRHNGSVDELVTNGKACGVKGFLVCSVATTPEQVQSINDFIAEECALHPEFYGFGTLHPMMEDIGCEIDRIINLGLRGIKLHPDFQRFNVDAPEAYSIYDMVEDRLPILFHIGDDRYDYSHPRRLSKILGDFKHLRAIAAHLGGFKVWDEVKEYLIKPNVWFDTSSTLALLGKEAAKEHMRMLGIDRCFFGTDYPLWDYQREVQNFLTLGLKDDENRRILSGNIKAFLQICQ